MPPPAARRPVRVLLAEDCRTNQRLVLQMLKRVGYDCVIAENGLLACQAGAEEPFDLILMDCFMPELDGLDAARAIRAREHAAAAPRTPIVAISANDHALDREQCLQAGMDDYLVKPFRPAELYAMLAKWLT
jgi:CheY-like chemotaxis protein